MKKDKNNLSRAQAKYLHNNWLVGATFLVKDEDGTCYLVDHGAGELEKENGHWIDTDGPDSQINSFEEADYNFDIVSWEDEEPLDIYDYLEENGWADGQNFIA